MRFTSVFLISTTVFCILSSKVSALPATFVVSNTNDSGAGSLRQAILDANNNGNPADMDIIEFDIPGSNVHTIELASALPDVNEKVTIDGYTQTDAQVNTAIAPNPLNNAIKIEIDFDNISNHGMTVNADDTIIKGLAIFSSTPKGSYIRFNANNSEFSGNYAGLRADGMTQVDNEGSTYVSILEFSAGYSGCRLGGTNAQDRNVIASLSKSANVGTVIIDANNCTVKGNFIGLAKDGRTQVGGNTSSANTFDKSLGINQNYGSTSLVVGGSEPGAINVLSGSTMLQMNAGGQNAVIQGNYFGTEYNGQVNPSIINGVGAAGGLNTLIGGPDPGEGNTFAGLSGVAIGVSTVSISEYNYVFSQNNIAILGNSISKIGVFNYTGFGTTNLGIDLLRQESNTPTFDGTFEFFDRGPNMNDTGDADSGANGYINTPVLKSAQQIGNQLTVTYDLDAKDSPSNSYRVEFFANNERSIFGHGPGEIYLGAVTTSPGNSQTATITVPNEYAGKSLSATTTAIDSTTPSGFGSTSEFSQNINIGSQTDFDADGSLDALEDQGPNGGDANNDGILDSQQPTVTTYKIYSTEVYATFITEGCSENGTVASIDVRSLSNQDEDYDYPYGLTDFSLNCSRGNTATITKYIWDNIDSTGLSIRKYNPVSGQYFNVADISSANSLISNETIAGNQALKLTYQIKDGGGLDDDQTENGIIVDPVGIAMLAPTSIGSGTVGAVGVPNTGIEQYWLLGLKR